MAVYMVTVKLPKNPEHDPKNKVAGACPVNGGLCTDVTGEHHTLLMTGDNVAAVLDEATRKYGHVTRLEAV